MTRLLQIMFFVWIATGVNAEDLNIRIDGKVNGKPVRLILGTGADGTAICRSAAKRLELKFSEPPEGVDLTPGAAKCGTTETCQLDIFGISSKARFAVVDMPTYFTRDLDGVLSLSDLNFLFCYIYTNTETLEFKDALPANICEWTKWELLVQSKRLEFDVPETPKGKGTIAINTGSPEGVELSTELWEKWRKEHPDQPATLVAQSTSSGRVDVSEICWAKELSIGGFTIRDVPVCKAMPESEYGRKSYLATLGLFALSRLNIIIDKKAGKVYTRTCSDSLRAYPYNRLGAVFVPTDLESQDLVAHVVKGSPADKAGIRNGDILMKIGDLDTTKWCTDPNVKLSRFWEQPTGTKLNLTLKRDNQRVEILVVLEDILSLDNQDRQSGCVTNQLVVFRAQAEEGIARAQSKMAEFYFFGMLGLPTNDVEGVKWLRKAADQKYADDQFNLGNCYYSGKGVDKDISLAIMWWRKAAEQNDSQAQYNLGLCYESGQGVVKEGQEAVKWYRKAAEQNHPEAQYALCMALLTGKGVEKDDVEAVKWCRRAAEQNDPNAQELLGSALATGRGMEKDETEAVKWFRRAAEQNHAASQYNLGHSYQNGLGVIKDEQEAVKWYRKAADQNFAASQYNLGVCYQNGLGVIKDEQEAVKWYRKAAEQNHPAAQSNLGLALSWGRGVEKDDVEAVKWWRKSAQQNHPEAQNALGVALATGKGVEKDDPEAVKWFRKAAEQGVANSQRNMAIFLALGRGVAKDNVEAFAWSCVASMNNSSAIGLCSELEKRLTPAELAAGDRRTRALRAEIEARLKSPAK